MPDEVKSYMESWGFMDTGTDWYAPWAPDGVNVSYQAAESFYKMYLAATRKAKVEVLEAVGAGIDSRIAALPYKQNEAVDLQFDTFDHIKKSSLAIQDNGRMMAYNEQRQAIDQLIKDLAPLT